MKFAKELERDQIPEWRAKYLDYKGGKKKLKAIDRALRNVSQTPRLRRHGTNILPSPFDAAPKYAFLNRDNLGRDTTSMARDPDDLRALAITNSRNSAHERSNGSRAARTPEEEPLTRAATRTGYGSITGGRPPSLQLPGAALDPDDASPRKQKQRTVQLPESALETDNAFEVGKTRSPQKPHASLPARYKSIFSPKRMNSMPGPTVESNPRPSIRRIFSMGNKSPPPSPGDVPLEAYRELDFRQAEFFGFLDLELEKVESFYKEKETEATHRLDVLRDQLHIMRDRRLDELIRRQTAKMKAKSVKKHVVHGQQLHGHTHSPGDETPRDNKANGDALSASWLTPLDAALEAISAGKYGNSTKNMTQLASPSGLQPNQHPDDRRDYVRRPDLPDVPYQAAKRKLKVALQEYYRGLELLKSYALLNRTAFRKINKKYDKTVNARPSMRYMSEKVNQAWFVNSDVIEGHIRQAEDLYARYFERGNHKVAVGKLRIKVARAGDYTDNTFRNGLLLSAGTILGLQGLIKATSIADLRNTDNSILSMKTSYLLQIYAGYFLINFLLLLFCLACRVWHEAKINYVFIFEYDTRHYLDWRQLAEVSAQAPSPSFTYLQLTASMLVSLLSWSMHDDQLPPSWG
ncbi:SPX-domain-containing protein [Dothidotthia symphoricarpi CBS 119687]|uniref:SPX-domain-containing protein n=1 Tax=Dothidotthia symphoricarpi CBS 119687 TaxID=1392245 RepID=A0A6A6A0V2_9PLEO|nr:SPX-domain-containing protein [Dothidotthia symphoricarpi CBS 119687]KAF2125479.1 SPX-domain-containing protein [Dothidotthia symphoricarpi CBS 119687]